jgi:hypothetical protein
MLCVFRMVVRMKYLCVTQDGELETWDYHQGIYWINGVSQHSQFWIVQYGETSVISSQIIYEHPEDCGREILEEWVE